MTAVLDYLDDILDSVEKIKRYTGTFTYSSSPVRLGT